MLKYLYIFTIVLVIVNKQLYKFDELLHCKNEVVNITTDQ